MSLQIPFANQLIPTKADLSDSGGIHSTIPFANPDAVMSSALVPANTRVLIGDDISGIMAWADYTAASNNFTIDDFPIYTGQNSIYCIALEPGDDIESFDWYETDIGSYTLTAGSITVFYRNAAGALVEQTGIAVPDMQSTGIHRLMLTTPIQYDNVGEMDDPIDPSLIRRRFVFYKFVGVTGVYTTGPNASLFWKRRTATATRIYSDVTAAVNATDKTPYTSILALSKIGDRLLFGFDCRTPVLVSDISRAIGASSSAIKWIYSKGGGVFGDFAADDIHIMSSNVGTTVPFTKTGQYVDCFVPPSDFAVDTIGAYSNLFWIGVEHTADGTAPTVIGLYTIKGMCITDAAAAGVRAGEAATYTLAEIFVQTSSASSSMLFFGNKTTGRTGIIKIPANAEKASSVISIQSALVDEIVFALLHGDVLLNVADGFIRLS
jgi:hypothetical protein